MKQRKGEVEESAGYGEGDEAWKGVFGLVIGCLL
jgi:hypothetical protein